MSFFKKMVDKFEDLLGDDDKKKEEKKKDEKKKDDHHEGTKDHSSLSQQTPYGQQPQYNNPQTYGAPPPLHSTPGGPPRLPPGWISQWDPNTQRYYYLEQSTGRTQWDPPQHPIGGYPPPMSGGGGGYSNYQNQPQPAPYTQETKPIISDTPNKDLPTKPAKKDGKGNMLAAGAGGLAVGAVGGAMIGHAMDDSSDEEHHPRTTYIQQQQQQPTYYQPPPVADHNSISSSDRESLAEAREKYENASDASDREEAREEYREEYEEAYGGD
ncbi:MAG: hypothetical protein Q9182_000854 [Xanthomendoza sp. 2 TL-2023]